MRVVRDLFLAVAVLLLVVGMADRSVRALSAVCICGATAYGIQRRLIAVWWAGCALLLWSAVDALLGALRGPGTRIAVMSSVLAIFVSALLLSVWLRQRPYFRRDATSKAQPGEGEQKG